MEEKGFQNCHPWLYNMAYFILKYVRIEHVNENKRIGGNKSIVLQFSNYVDYPLFVYKCYAMQLQRCGGVDSSFHSTPVICELATPNKTPVLRLISPYHWCLW